LTLSRKETTPSSFTRPAQLAAGQSFAPPRWEAAQGPGLAGQSHAPEHSHRRRPRPAALDESRSGPQTQPDDALPAVDRYSAQAAPDPPLAPDPPSSTSGPDRARLGLDWAPPPPPPPPREQPRRHQLRPWDARCQAPPRWLPARRLAQPQLHLARPHDAHPRARTSSQGCFLYSLRLRRPGAATAAGAGSGGGWEGHGGGVSFARVWFASGVARASNPGGRVWWRREYTSIMIATHNKTCHKDKCLHIFCL
jgi:hypothetical protein